MNKFIGMGRLTKDPEIRTTPNQVSVATFTIAIDRRFKNANGERQADFISCVAWRGTGENIAKYFHKGDGIVVEGTVQSRSWEAEDGTRRFATEVIVDEFHFLPRSKSDAAPADAPAEGFGFNEPEDDGSLPFDL